MKLYYSPAACSMTAHIAAREAGIPVELVKVDLATHTLQDGTDYHTINPRGYVPALQLDDGTVLTEVVAIAQYLADLSPASQLAPPAGSMERVHVQEWLAFVSSELHKAMSPWLWHKETAASTVQSIHERLAPRLAEMDRLLARQPYLTGERFTVADAYAFVIVNWAHFVKISLRPYPALVAFQQRIAARPQVVAAMQAEGLLRKAA